MNKRPRIVVAQSARANPLYRAYRNNWEFEPVKAEKTLASAIQIGNPVSIHKAVNILKQFDGMVEEASEQELVDACAMADKTGMYTCPHTGVALAALMKLRRKGEVSENDKTIVISTAHGLKFSGFKLQYHKSELPGVTSSYANTPVEAEPEVDQIKKIIDRHFGNN